ncbi:MAG: Fic family protein [Candidatus Altiarchaeota archaeon]|nr:Fic family protein [Candidatus Altiarchaeota archaeon]
MTQPPWHPRYVITPAIARGLMEIEAARAVVDETPLPLAAEAELRHRARLRSTHHSTRIEGNRLTLAEAEEAISGREIEGRERDVAEVRNYWAALLRVEEWAAEKKPLSEELIRRLHALVTKGSGSGPESRADEGARTRPKPTPYRDGQNVIRDSVTGAIVYLPPEAKDVPVLMAAMVRWAHQAEGEGLPVPLIAALVHYQFVTIHPYYDGNGRTARLLATFILHRGGYGLNGLFSLEELHSQDLEGYYRALATHPHHNYYEGREEADLTPWLEYFIETTAGVFRMAKDEALRSAREGGPTEPEELRRLDPRARAVLALFSKMEEIKTSDVAEALGLSRRMARVLINGWIEDGWLVVADPSKRGRSYELSAIYRQYIGRLSAMPRDEE